jgi:hypothetical protein
MKRVLETGLNCGCLRLEDCAVVLEAGGCQGEAPGASCSTPAISATVERA